MFMRRVFLESEWSEKHDLDRDAILKIPKCFFLHHCEKNNWTEFFYITLYLCRYHCDTHSSSPVNRRSCGQLASQNKYSLFCLACYRPALPHSAPMILEFYLLLFTNLILQTNSGITLIIIIHKPNSPNKLINPSSVLFYTLWSVCCHWSSKAPMRNVFTSNRNNILLIDKKIKIITPAWF